ncbi:unnamed protein product [Caenorhabditis sp. 36 PRJEB53466]|nr:unnamed protein product [Caenorhabditis sp. 36 PRJEB53466]
MSDDVNAVISIVDASLADGLFDAAKISEGLEAIVQLGAVVKGYNPDEPIAELADLKGKLEELSGKLTEHLNELTALIGGDEGFYKTLTETLTNLLTVVAESVGEPDDDKKGSVEGAVNENPPLEYGYKLQSVLGQDSGNPIKIAWNQDPQESTVLHWKTILGSVFGQLLFIEAYVSGLLRNGDLYGAEELKLLVTGFDEDVEKWKKELEPES